LPDHFNTNRNIEMKKMGINFGDCYVQFAQHNNIVLEQYEWKNVIELFIFVVSTLEEHKLKYTAGFILV